MLGHIPGNYHPWSWSAILNGYDPAAMAACPFASIPEYLARQPAESKGVDGVEVTHIWTDHPDDAHPIARAAKISHVVGRPEEVIGEVDAVIIATDDGSDHVRRARPFIEAGLPVFVDKPLATTAAELRQFHEWHKEGALVLSSSGMRYAPALEKLKHGSWLWLTSITCKTWERYGIHALEPLYVLCGPGFLTARSERSASSDIVYLQHRDGTQCTIAAIETAYGSFGAIHAYGEKCHTSITLDDTYAAFRGQLVAVAKWFETKVSPYPFSHTEELMCILLAALRSRESGGRTVPVEEIYAETCA